MKFKHVSELGKYLLLGLALISMAVVLFGCGKDGSTGPAGPAASNSSTVTGTAKDLYGNNVANVAVTYSPTVSGVTISPTDANGLYTAVLPNGQYTLTFTKSGYTTQTQTVNAVANSTVPLDVYLVPTGPFAVNAGTDKTVAISSAADTSYTLPGVAVTYYDPSVSQAGSVISWSVVNGDATIASGGSTLTPVITLKKKSDYKKVLAEQTAAPRWSETAPVTYAALERWRVVPLTVAATRAAAQGTVKAATLRVTVTNGSTTATDDVVLAVALNVVPNTGIRNVPVGQPVLLQGPTIATYAWTMTGPTGSTATLNDATTRYPDFIPDAVGTYTISEAGTARITVYAGKYYGMMAGYQTADIGCGSSGGCHAAWDNNARMSTWMATGHKAVMFTGMMELPPGGHYNPASCAACHATGWNYYTTTVQSDSFFEKMNSVTNVAGLKLVDWFNNNHMQGNPNVESAVATNFPSVYKLTGIQCEVCHGPNNSFAHGGYLAASPYAATARIDFSSNACGYCHGRPPTHGRFQQWNSSGHASYELAQAEGGSAGCSGCHSAQGFFLLKTQLAGGTGNRTITVPTYLTASTVEPITCIVCHDPHSEGKMISITGGVTTDAAESIPVRIQNNTDLLPGGFMATGVGRGAQCIFCHNSRNGNYSTSTWNAGTSRWVSTFSATYLHEDGATGQFANGNVTYSRISPTNTSNDPLATYEPSYTAPHAACQGDVLMGRNAYFLGVSTPGERSKHSFLADSCVTCHMTIAKAPTALRSTSAWSANHTFTATVEETCKECHSEKFEGGTVPTYFASQLSTLNLETAKAIYRIKNAGVNPPDGTTVSFTGGRTPAIVINSVSTALHKVNAARTGYDGYLDGVAGLTNLYGYDPTIAKLNWNYELLRTGAGNGTHNPSFTWKVFDASIAAAKAR